MESIYLCDIDGTLADHQGLRSPYDETKVLNDKPLPTVEVIKALINNNNRVVFLSGRTEKCKKDTVKWLHQYVGIEFPEIYMRKEGDSRPDDVVKKQLHWDYIEWRYKVLGIFDDRLKVCRMWYEMGLFVFNCNQGLKEF